MTTWTDPRTHSVAGYVDAAILNTHVRDNQLHLRQLQGCRCTKSGTQTVVAGNNDVVSFNTETFDTDAIHDNVTNNSRFVVPTGLEGVWRFEAQVRIDADAVADRRVDLSLRKNAAGVSSGGSQKQLVAGFGAPVFWSLFAEVVVQLYSTDYMELFLEAVTEDRVIQTGGTFAQMTYLGE